MPWRDREKRIEGLNVWKGAAGGRLQTGRLVLVENARAQGLPWLVAPFHVSRLS